MAKIDVISLCGTSRISRTDGLRLRQEIKRLLHSDPEPIVVDFGNVTIASLGFLDEGLGILALEYSLNLLRKRISVENMTEPDRAELNKLMLARSIENIFRRNRFRMA